MHKPESILENETHEILWDLEIQVAHQIQARRSDLVLISKKTKQNKKQKNPQKNKTKKLQ